MNHSTSFRGRIKDSGHEPSGPAFFHCMSRVVAGQRLLKRPEQEMFRRMMRRQAAFSGVTILTYAVMSNHFHLLVRVDPRPALTDEQLLDRVRALYGDAKARLIRRWLADEIHADRVRSRLLKRMHDVSFFLKELKQRFSVWYNHRHDRFGTLWAEKFKSVYVQGDREVLMKVAGYIDLNPVRAGLCQDPKDYRFCGYGEAVGGGAEARAGLRQIIRDRPWNEIQRTYRLLLFGKGYHSDLTQGRIPETALRKALEEKGELSLADALRCRLRYFSDGLAIGTEAFIASLFREKRKRYWKKRKKAVHSFSGAEWDGLCALSGSRHRE